LICSALVFFLLHSGPGIVFHSLLWGDQNIPSLFFVSGIFRRFLFFPFAFCPSLQFSDIMSLSHQLASPPFLCLPALFRTSVFSGRPVFTRRGSPPAHINRVGVMFLAYISFLFFLSLPCSSCSRSHSTGPHCSSLCSDDPNRFFPFLRSSLTNFALYRRRSRQFVESVLSLSAAFFLLTYVQGLDKRQHDLLFWSSPLLFLSLLCVAVPGLLSGKSGSSSVCPLPVPVLPP